MCIFRAIGLMEIIIFFVKMDWTCGLFGHPWRQELCVLGEALIQAFEEEKERLNIKEIGDVK